MLKPSADLVITNSSVPSDFLVEGQVGGLGIVHPPSHFFSSFFLHMISSYFQEEDVIRNGWIPLDCIWWNTVVCLFTIQIIKWFGMNE